MTRFFVDRPVLVVVAALLVILGGIASVFNLPIERYPEIAPPSVSVRVVYPGASAETLEKTVATPIEAALTGIEDLLYMNSSSSNSVTTIQVFFEVGTDTDIAVVNVNNRVKQVESQLPLESRRQGIVVNKDSSALMYVLGFYSSDGSRDQLSVSNYVNLNLLDKIKRVPGTTNVQFFGGKQYAMRIWLNPARLAQLKLTPLDLINAIREQNNQYATGSIGSSPAVHGQQLTYTINAKGRLTSPEQFRSIVIRANKDGSALRLGDVAKVELASQDYSIVGRYSGKEATLVGVYLLPGANALATARKIDKLMEQEIKKFPAGIDYELVYETISFVEASIKSVVKTLAEAMILVFLVVLLFLQNFRATIIPFSAVPVSLCGAFIGIYLLGYSINTLTLFGIILSIGIVVDDAIVVLENVERIMHELGCSTRDAVLQAMREVGSPVIAIVLVLCSVFIPISFLGGLTGELYRQFAVSIAIAVMFSGITALTLTPTLCALLLKSEDRTKNQFFQWFNRLFAKITTLYEEGVIWMLRRGALALLLFIVMLISIVGLWNAVPKALVPDEDQGYFISAFLLPDGASLEKTDTAIRDIVKKVQSNPNIKHAVSFTGMDFLSNTQRQNVATVFFRLKDWKERSASAKDMVGDFYHQTSNFTDGLALAFSPPAIQGLGRSGGYEFYLQNLDGSDPEKMAKVAGDFIAAASEDPLLGRINMFWRPNVPQLFMDVDYAIAKARGVKLDDLYGTLASMLGNYYVNDFNKYGRTWQVLMSAESQFRSNPNEIGSIYVRNNNNQMIPVSALATISHTTGPDNLKRFNNIPAIHLFGESPPGVSTGQTIEAIGRLADKVLPPDFSYDWSGISFQEKRSSNTDSVALLAGTLMVFLILAAQYGNWSLPLAVMLALPFGFFGALLLVWLLDMTNNVYFQIGLVTLLGLSAKNAILLVEFAVQKSQEGYSATVSILESARLRFRPIIMTSLAFILGVLPLTLSSGAGSSASRAVGTGVVGGMLAATFLALFFVPVFFLWVRGKVLHETKTPQVLRDEVKQAHALSNQRTIHTHDHKSF